MDAPVIDVAAAVIRREDGSFLLGQRAPDTFYPGYWEFPGGKVESGETAYDALLRELHEELGIEVRLAYPWLTREHHYEHARVRLHFFEVVQWEGELTPLVHAGFSWQMPQLSGQSPVNVDISPMLPANAPVLKALCLPRIMGVTQAAQIGVTEQLAALDEALRQGLRCVQVREPTLEPEARERFAHEVVARCRAVDALVLINHDQALARQSGAGGLHLRAAQLAEIEARPDFEWVGASCHTEDDLARAAELGLDYALLGSVNATESHPGELGIGWPRFAQMLENYTLPVFAIGGLSPQSLSTAKSAKAHGIAAIRSIWQGNDWS